VILRYRKDFSGYSPTAADKLAEKSYLRSLDNSDRTSKLSKSTLVGNVRLSIFRTGKVNDGVSQKIPNSTIARRQDQAGMVQAMDEEWARRYVHTYSVRAPVAGGSDFGRQAVGLMVVREGTRLLSPVGRDADTAVATTSQRDLLFAVIDFGGGDPSYRIDDGRSRGAFPLDRGDGIDCDDMPRHGWN
jgi:hypothetical protein